MIESGSGGDVSGGEGERTLFNLCFIEAIEVISGFTFDPLSLFFLVCLYYTNSCPTVSHLATQLKLG